MGLFQSAGLLSGTFAAAFLAASTAASAIPRSTTVVFKGPHVAEADGMTNIHIDFAGPVDGELSIHYGSCDMVSPYDAHHRVGMTHVGDHPLAKRNAGWDDYRPTRFVWLPPADIQSGGCLHAFAGNELVGRSDVFTVKRRKARRSSSFADVADPMGPWFDGVEYLKEKEPDAAFVAQSKGKSVGIVGAGMSGLMSAVSHPLLNGHKTIWGFELEMLIRSASISSSPLASPIGRLSKPRSVLVAACTRLI